MPLIQCTACHGYGRRYIASSDTSAADAGSCRRCQGSGNQPCEYCHTSPATHRFDNGRGTDLICVACYDEAVEDAA